jgi:hypothetical protein
MTQQSIASLRDLTRGPGAESDWRQRAASILARLQSQANQQGFSGTIVTAKLTGGGSNGSMTFANGRLVSEVAAT